jgi:hypothetical protein
MILVGTMTIEPTFEREVGYLDLAALARSPDVVCIVDRDLRLMGFNDAWAAFARDNNGASILERYPLGSSISVGEEPLRSYIASKYRHAIENNTIFEQQYECSRPSAFRIFHQTAYPLNGGTGLVITHHLSVEKPHEQNAEVFSTRFVDENGIVTQCQNCRKVRDAQDTHTWYWVPALLEQPLPNVSHGICVPCMDYYYPDIDC